MTDVKTTLGYFQAMNDLMETFPDFELDTACHYIYDAFGAYEVFDFVESYHEDKVDYYPCASEEMDGFFPHFRNACLVCGSVKNQLIFEGLNEASTI